MSYAKGLNVITNKEQLDREIAGVNISPNDEQKTLEERVHVLEEIVQSLCVLVRDLHNRPDPTDTY